MQELRAHGAWLRRARSLSAPRDWGNQNGSSAWWVSRAVCSWSRLLLRDSQQGEDAFPSQQIRVHPIVYSQAWCMLWIENEDGAVLGAPSLGLGQVLLLGCGLVLFCFPARFHVY